MVTFFIEIAPEHLFLGCNAHNKCNRIMIIRRYEVYLSQKRKGETNYVKSI